MVATACLTGWNSTSEQYTIYKHTLQMSADSHEVCTLDREIQAGIYILNQVLAETYSISENFYSEKNIMKNFRLSNIFRNPISPDLLGQFIQAFQGLLYTICTTSVQSFRTCAKV